MSARIDQILEGICARSGLERSDGHPLYAYRTSREELEQLRDELKRCLSTRGALRPRTEFAAFCLFSSEWFRREYTGGTWSWDVIAAGLDCTDRQRQSLRSAIHDITADGLKWWNVEVIRTAYSQRYLTTLVCQGGIPLSTLRNDNAQLSRVLRRLLRFHERYPREVLKEVVADFTADLPTTLDNEEMQTLLIKLVEAISSLRDASDQSEERGLSRSELLDQTYKGWEKILPLRIEESEGRELLLSLLDTARHFGRDDQAFGIVTSLSLNASASYIERRIEFPTTLTEEEVLREFGFESAEEVFPRMTGFLRSGTTRESCFNIAKSSDLKTYRLSRFGPGVLKGSETKEVVRLILACSGTEIKKVPVAGGEALPDSPWVFADDDSHRLIGVGSLRTRHTSALIALPPDARCSSENVEAIEYLENTVEARKIIRLSGSAEIVSEGSLFRIATGTESDSEVLFELRGKKRRLGANGSEVWLGQPKIWRMLADSHVPQEVPHQLIEWRARTPGAEWQRMSPRCHGDVLLRVVEEEETLFQTRAIIFPEQFSLRVMPGREPNTGKLLLYHLGRVKVSSKRDPAIEIKPTREPDHCCLEVVTIGQRPSLIYLMIRFESGATSEVAIDCPTQAIGLVDCLGQTVTDAGIPLEHLGQLRLQVIDPQDFKPDVYDIKNDLLLDSARNVSSGIWELPLSYISDRALGALSVSDDPDSFAQFGVVTGRARIYRYEWKVTRYARKIEPERDLSRFTADEHCTVVKVAAVGNSQINEDAEELVLSVYPMDRPGKEMPSEAIQAIDTGYWKIDHTSFPAGYYLAIARSSDGEVLRPLRFVVKPGEFGGDETETQLESGRFSSICRMRSRSERRVEWDNYFSELADNPTHPDWSRINELIEASRSLPITTFEAVAGLTRNMEAAARIGFQSPKDYRLWQRLEELPFLWSAISIEAWLKGVRGYLGCLRAALDDSGLTEEQVEELLTEQINDFVVNAPQRQPGLGILAATMFRLGQFSDPNLLSLNGTALEDRERERLRLIQSHERYDTRRTWPSPKIEFEDVKAILRTTPGLEIVPTYPNQYAVLNAPAILAARAVYGLPSSPDQIAEFKILRAADPEWFDRANAVALRSLLDRRFSEEPGCFEKAIQVEDLE